MISKPFKRVVTAKEDLFYQAIGLIQGNLTYQDKEVNGASYTQFTIWILDQSYRLTLHNNCQYFQNKLRSVVDSYKDPLYPNQSLPLWFRVYPNWNLKDSCYQFEMLYWSVKQPEEPEGFTLRGIWQKVPVLKGNYFTIYRNQVGSPKFRNQYLPVIWDRPVYVPSKIKRATFSVVHANFVSGNLVVDRLVSLSEKLPYRVKRRRAKTGTKESNGILNISGTSTTSSVI
jgi:hypothetical protein